VSRLEDILAKLDGARRSGDGWAARCPAHDDRSPSLTIGEGDDGRVLLHCQAGCTLDAICAALGLDLADLFPPKQTNRKAEIVATYDYVDEAGALLFQVVRMRPKDFRQRRPDGQGGWIWKLTAKTPRVLYRLPEVLEAVAAARTVFVAEGEKDVDALRAAGEAATCNPMGAGKWRAEHAQALEGAAKVVVVADADDRGREHAQAVADSLAGHVGHLLVVEALKGKDAADHLGAGLGIDELVTTYDSETSISLGKDRNRATAPAAPPELASHLRILEAFAAEVRGCGLVGERATAQLLYLVITSRLLDKPVSLGVKGHSSSGKSFVVETTCRFFPPAAVLEFTAMSQRSLVYSPDNYQHRTLIVYEVVALREGVEDDLTAYFVRSLLSEGRINYAVTVRDKDGGWTTKTITKEGPTGLVFTTTRARIHGENETRVLSVTSDDSRAQTARVLHALAASNGAGPDLRAWHALQSWLQHAEHRVEIPYARALAELVPPVAVRLRRDFGALLSLIRAHAILHQQTRDRDPDGRIVATLDDYDMVAGLIAPLIAEGVGATVSAATRETVETVRDLSNAYPDGVPAAVVAKRLDLDKSNVSRRLSVAGAGGWLTNLEDRRGRAGRWRPGEDLPDETIKTAGQGHET
jgi:5S rRNA maturation endonuclease (ribonuclease M5)